MGSVKKLVTGFAEIFVCEITIYLFARIFVLRAYISFR